MSGYFFPPPPPPPPPVPSQPPPIQSQAPQNAYSHRGGAASGGYGRGRGNYHGHGNAPYGQGAYQNPGYQNTRGNHQRGGFSRGHHAYSGPQAHANHAPSYPNNPHQPSWPVSQQHGANPGFNHWMGPGNANSHAFQHSSLPPNSFAPNMSHYQQAYPPAAQASFPSNQPQYPIPAVAPPLRLGFSDGSNSIVELTPPQNTFANGMSYANKKRKRDNDNFPHNFRRGPGGSGPPHQRQRNQNVTRVPASPSVPAFGVADMPGNPSPRQSKGNAKKKNKKRNPNNLGLTPSGNMHEPSDEEVDEEAAFRASGTSESIVYKGKTITLSTAEDLRAWIEERKKRYPTQARIEMRLAERKALQEKRKQAKFERRQKAKEQAKPATPVEPAEKSRETPPPSKAQGDVERQKKKLEKHLRKAEKLRALLEKSEGAGPSDPSQESVDGPQPSSAAEPSSEGAATGGAQDAANSTDSADSSDSSDSSSDSGDSGSESSSDDSEDAKDAKKPENSRSNKAKIQKKVNTNVPCKYFIRDGQCLRKDCRFLHHAPDGEKRKSLFETMSEKESREESIKALDVIKALGDAGCLE